MFGARAHYALPLMLHRAGRLGVFHTDFYAGNKRLLRYFRSAPRAARPTALAARDCPGLDAAQVCSLDLLGIAAAALSRRARSRGDKIRHYTWVNHAFGVRVARRLKPGAAAVYAFNGAALEIFDRALALGRLRILEQGSSAGRVEAELLAEEALRWPGWEPPDPDSGDAAEQFYRREAAEWTASSLIVCGSQFVAAGLSRMGVGGEKLRVVPYGVDLRRFTPTREAHRQGPLRILFVGNLGLQKGLPYLFAALERLGGGLRCRAVGPQSILPSRLAELGRRIEISGPLPRAEVERAYRWADVLVLPSICEGSALAVYEAMACGLPVIVTPNTGSVARDGADGYVVPIRDPDALAARLEHLARERELLRAMGHSARARIEHYSVERYGAALLRVIDEAAATAIGVGNRAAAHARADGAAR